MVALYFKGIFAIERAYHRTPGTVCTSTAKTAASPIKTCSTGNCLTADCGNNVNPTATACGYNVSCEKGGTGKCDGSAVCG